MHSVILFGVFLTGNVIVSYLFLKSNDFYPHQAALSRKSVESLLDRSHFSVYISEIDHTFESMD